MCASRGAVSCAHTTNLNSKTMGTRNRSSALWSPKPLTASWWPSTLDAPRTSYGCCKRCPTPQEKVPRETPPPPQAGLCPHSRKGEHSSFARETRFPKKGDVMGPNGLRSQISSVETLQLHPTSKSASSPNNQHQLPQQPGPESSKTIQID